MAHVLQLSGQTERVEPYKGFYGQPRIQMPLLVSGKDEQGNVVDVPRTPASFGYILDRRMNAPKDVREAWQNNYFFTGDGSTAGAEGDHLIVLDSRHLREITAESELYHSAFVLPDGAWDELKAHKENVLYLTAEEAQQAHGKGYVKKSGVWVPANRTVAKVWDILSGGRDLISYIQLVSENSPNRESLLNVYLNQTTTKDGKPTMRSWVALRVDLDSDAVGYNSLDDRYGRLVGVAPEAHVGRALEARVQSALQQGTEFEFNGRLYVPVDASTRLTR